MTPKHEDAIKAPSTALVVVEENYPALQADTRANALAAIRANLGEMEVTPQSLNRVTVPSGGSTFFSVASIEEPDGEAMKTLTGVIVYQRDVRAYWKLGMDEGGGGTPPDCRSDDGRTGIGDPGGDCKKCAFAQFHGDERPACKQMRLMFLLRPGMYLPDVVQVPPSSLKNAAQYMLRLASQGIPYYAVETTIGLEKAQNADSIDYAKLTFKPTGRVHPESVDQITEYAASLRDLFRRVAVVVEP